MINLLQLINHKVGEEYKHVKLEFFSFSNS